MTTTMVIGAARDMLILTFILVSPFLVATILASLAIGLFQPATRINDVTLSFVPRFFATLLLGFFLAHWLGARLVAYIERSVMASATLVN